MSTDLNVDLIFKNTFMVTAHVSDHTSGCCGLAKLTHEIHHHRWGSVKGNYKGEKSGGTRHALLMGQEIDTDLRKS